MKDGLGAVQTTHKDYLSVELRTAFADSIDIDAALKAGHESENRWDYLLGHAPSGLVVAVEPHSARDDEIATVINKRAAARAQLKDHLRPGAKIARWLWVASGKVRFASTEKAGFRLAQHGIEFVGSQVQAKHLPTQAAAPTRGTGKPRRESPAGR
ncbi:hypothetical protein L6V77_27440 [Myxococcota bacterium]|nr:hypothetical protein [Myxococcota bacterium]